MKIIGSYLPAAIGKTVRFHAWDIRDEERAARSISGRNWEHGAREENSA